MKPSAPLDPDSFLAWFWAYHGSRNRAPTWREWAMSMEMIPDREARHHVVHWAARVRYWQRLGTYPARHGTEA